MIHDGWYLWLVVVGMAFVTILNRAGLLMLSGRFNLPPGLQASLRYAPAAALAAIAVPELFVDAAGAINLSIYNVKLIAGLAGFAIAMLWRSTVPAIVGGMLVLHGLSAWIG
jgi:branched-subunit amino acid transport protein